MYPRAASPSKPSDAGSRARQVADVIEQIPSCHPLNRDQSLFEIPIRIQDGSVGGRQTALRISLPQDFPKSRPGLSVTQPLRHAWVDPAGRLMFPSLQHWVSSQTTLLAVVAEVLTELVGSHTPERQSPTHRNSGGAVAGAQSRQPALQQQQQAFRNQAEAVPPEFPILDTMSIEQLHLLLVDERAYRDLVQRLAAESANGAVQRQLRTGNADLAAANLAKEADIAELRNQIAIIRSSEFALAKEAFDAKLARQQAVLDKISPEKLVAGLAAAAEDLDAQTDALHDKFEAGELSVESFQQQHLQLRQQFHLLDVKRQAAEQTLL